MTKIPTTNGLDAKSAGSVALGNQASEKAKALQSRQVTTEKDVNKAASGFEALLLQEMMQSMWSTVEFSGMFNEESNQAGIYRDMFNQAIADTVSEGQGIGVKKFLQQQLLKTGKHPIK